MEHIDTIIGSIARAVRIPAKHQRDLPFAIRDLSRLLTEERGNLHRSYWAAPRFLSAYVYYFLPWNLYRLAFLLPNLHLPLQPESRILDMGSGPLTLPLALWCTRPELRSMPLHFVCSDIAQKPMEVGLDILKQADPETPWTFTLERGALEKVLTSHALPFDVIMGGNVLNELTPPKGMTLEDRVANISRLFPKKLTEESTVLLIEPGTRLGGKMLSLARKGALACGFEAVAPCSHSDPCPVLEQSAYYAKAPLFNGWCHFICDVDAAPETLHALTSKAGFKRETLALSFLQMQWQGGEAVNTAFGDSSFDLDDLESLYAESMHFEDDDFSDEGHEAEQEESMQKTSSRGKAFQGHMFGEQRSQKEPSKKIALPKLPCKARIISGDIRLATSTARYACSEAGLLLVAGARGASYGEQILASWKTPLERDAKTSAILSSRVDVRNPYSPREERGAKKTSTKGTHETRGTTYEATLFSREERATRYEKNNEEGRKRNAEKGQTLHGEEASPRYQKERGVRDKHRVQREENQVKRERRTNVHSEERDTKRTPYQQKRSQRGAYDKENRNQNSSRTTKKRLEGSEAEKAYSPKKK